MEWQFWKSGNKIGDIPARMAAQLGWRFGISVENMKGLRLASRPGQMKKTMAVRVFNPKLLVGDASSVRSYEDLDKHQAAVQFECRWHPKSSKMDEVVDLRPA